MTLVEKCLMCKETGLDPKTYDEYIQSNGFWFTRPCKYCKGSGKDERLLYLFFFYALYGFKFASGIFGNVIYGSDD